MVSLYEALDEGLAALIAGLARIGVDTTDLVMTRQGQRRFMLEFRDRGSGAAVRPWGSTAYTPTGVLDLMQFAVTAMALPLVESGARHRVPATNSGPDPLRRARSRWPLLPSGSRASRSAGPFGAGGRAGRVRRCGRAHLVDGGHGGRGVRKAPAGTGTAAAFPSRRRRGGSEGLRVSSTSSSRVQSQPAAGSCRARGGRELSLPDPGVHRGGHEPGVTQATIGSTVRVSGYTAAIRPAVSVTDRENRASMAASSDPKDHQPSSLTWSVAAGPEEWPTRHHRPPDLLDDVAFAPKDRAHRPPAPSRSHRTPPISPPQPSRSRACADDPAAAADTTGPRAAPSTGVRCSTGSRPVAAVR